jgi:hypothetical protein
MAIAVTNNVVNVTFAKQHSEVAQRPTRTRIIQDPLASFANNTSVFLVPGGRYLLSYSAGGYASYDMFELKIHFRF